MDQIDRNIFIIDNYDSYCNKWYAKEHPKNTKLILNKNNYFFYILNN